MDTVLGQIAAICGRFPVERAILFGSRARGDNSDVSDYDIAIYGNRLTEPLKARLWDKLDDIETLKKLDAVFVDANTPPALVANIQTDGVVIYEQVQ